MPFCTRISILLLILLAGAPAPFLPGGDEDRFDPPLEGAYLGVRGAAREESLVLETIDAGSPAEAAGVRRGDVILRLGEAAGLRTAADLAAAIRDLRPGVPVDLEVRRGDEVRAIRVVPEPAVLGTYRGMVEALLRSRFFQGRTGFPEAIAAIEEEVPPALRLARRRSEAAEVLNRSLGRLGASHTAFIPAWTYRNLLACERDGSGGY